MLTPAEVIPYLESDDRILREYALRYLRECNDPAPLTADDYWRALDKLGEKKQTRGLASALDTAPQTEQSLARLLRAISAGPTEGFVEHYQSALWEISLPLLVAHREELLAFPSIAPDVRAYLERRLVLRDLPIDALWDRLMQEGIELADSYANEIETSESDALIDALGHRADQSICQKAVAVLDDPTAFEDWRMIFAVEVLGLRRYEPAIPRLMDILATDGDLLLDKANEALWRIGTDEVIEKILEFYPEAEWGTRLYLGEALSHIKRPESEAALIKLLEMETGDDLIVVLLQALTALGSLAGLEQSRQVMRESDDPETRDIAQNLLAVAAIQGVNLPEAAEWRAVAEAWLEKWDKTPELYLSDEEDAYDADAYDANLEDIPVLPTMAELAPRQEVIEPIRRAAPKIGRNDPCPCGSGKKYKKCCLGKDG